MSILFLINCLIGPDQNHLKLLLAEAKNKKSLTSQKKRSASKFVWQSKDETPLKICYSRAIEIVWQEIGLEL